MYRYELNHTGSWVTLVTVTPEVADSIRALMDSRGSQPGKSWRLTDASKPVAKPRARKATRKASQPASEPVEAAK